MLVEIEDCDDDVLSDCDVEKRDVLVGSGNDEGLDPVVELLDELLTGTLDDEDGGDPISCRFTGSNFTES